METTLLSLFSLVFFVFAFGINVVVIAFRAIIEAIFKKVKIVLPEKLKGFLLDVWNEWILPAAPVIIGGLMARFISDYPYPQEFASSASGRLFFGLIAGFFSATVYRFAKFHIKKYVPEEIKSKIGGMAKQMNLKETTDIVEENTESTVDEPSKPNE
jgi:hypothetical protein